MHAEAAVVTTALPVSTTAAMGDVAAATNMSKNWVTHALAFLIVVSFIAAVAAFLRRPPEIQGESLQLLNTFLGILAAAFTAIVSYYFGSSSGSKDKDDTISGLVDKPKDQKSVNGVPVPEFKSKVSDFK